MDLQRHQPCEGKWEVTRMSFNQHDRWYAAGLAGGVDSVYSTRLCCYCARPVRADAFRLLTARTNDGEWWLVSSDEDMSAPEWSQFQGQIDGTPAPTQLPVGPECLRQHPEWKFAVNARAKENGNG